MDRRGVLRAILGSAAAPIGVLLGLGGIPPANAQQRRILVIAANQDITDFDPQVASGYSAVMLLRNVYDSLVRIEGDPARVVPHLATSWSMAPDGREYTFNLDPAARFHDGSPVTAEAVQYSFNRLLRLNKGYAWMVVGILDESSVQPVNARTVRIKLLQPFAPFLQVLPWIWVVNPKVVEANKGSDDGQTYLRTNIASSGAFRVKRFEPGNLYEFEKVERPWKSGGNLTGAIWRIVRETSLQRILLQRGEVHIAVELSSEDIDALKGNRDIMTVIRPEYRPYRMMMNVKHGPLSDINLRKAISYAFNYQALLDSAGYGTLLTGPLQPGLIGFDENLVVPRMDLDKAKQYLAKSKAPNGGIKLTMVYLSGWEPQRRYALVLLDSLKKLNIDLDIKPMVWPDMVASVRTPESTADFFSVYVAANYADTDNFAYAGYHSSRNGNWQNPVYGNPKVDDLIMRGRVESDLAKRAAIYKEFQRAVVDDAPCIFGVIEARKLAMRANVRGFSFTPVSVNAIDFFNISLT
jgi:peptide/nickel transport system substrate-binding protein